MATDSSTCMVMHEVPWLKILTHGLLWQAVSGRKYNTSASKEWYLPSPVIQSPIKLILDYLKF